MSTHVNPLSLGCVVILLSIFSKVGHRPVSSNPNNDLASFPAPECEYVCAGRAWYLSPRENNVNEKGPEFLEQNLTRCSTNYTLLSMYDIHPPITRCVW